MTGPPQWALDLATEVCTAYDVDAPSVSWRRRRRHSEAFIEVGDDGLEHRIAHFVSGTYDIELRTINILSSSDLNEGDMRMTLLHELAHHLTPHLLPWAAHHEAFYEVCFDLYDRWLSPADCKEAKRFECGYRKAAARVLARRG